jgi:Tfp pilus assembly protein PilV
MPAHRPSSGSAPIRRGLTLVEALVSLALVALLVLAGLGAMGASFRFRQAARATTGDELALHLITEIVQSNYEEPELAPTFGREFESSVSRDGWDDVDDYDGWTASPPQAKDGTVMTEFTGWTHAASVQLVDPETLAPVGTDAGLKLIIVTVFSPSGARTALTALRSANGSYDQRPALGSDILTWIGFELEATDGDGATITGATNLLNPIVVETNP